MKFSLALSTLLVAMASAASSADLISQVPECAKPCLDQALASAGCGTGDFACACGKVSELTPTASSCLLKASCDSSVILSKSRCFSKFVLLVLIFY